MEWTVEMDPSGRFVRVVVTGTYSVEGQIRLVDDITSQPFWKPGTYLLVDNLDLDMEGVTYDDMKSAGEVHIPFDDRLGDGRVAVVMASQRDFGSARQFQLLTEPEIASSIGVFLDQDEAVEWLTE